MCRAPFQQIPAVVFKLSHCAAWSARCECVADKETEKRRDLMLFIHWPPPRAPTAPWCDEMQEKDSRFNNLTGLVCVCACGVW